MLLMCWLMDTYIYSINMPEHWDPLTSNCLFPPTHCHECHSFYFEFIWHFTSTKLSALQKTKQNCEPKVQTWNALKVFISRVKNIRNRMEWSPLRCFELNPVFRHGQFSFYFSTSTSLWGTWRVCRLETWTESPVGFLNNRQFLSICACGYVRPWCAWHCRITGHTEPKLLFLQ